jgi:hypothetical protein
MNELREVYLNEGGYTGTEFISNWVQVSSIDSVRFSAYSAASSYTQSIEYAVDRNFSIIQTDSTSGVPGNMSVLNSNCVAAYCRFTITGFNTGDDLQLQAFILQSQYLNTGNGATGSTGCTGQIGVGSTGTTGSTGCTGQDGVGTTGNTGSTGCTGNFTPLSSTGPTGVLSLVNNSNAVLKGVTGGTGILLNDGTTFLLFSLSQYYIDLITNMSTKYLLASTTTPTSFAYSGANVPFTAANTFSSTSGDWTNTGGGFITYTGTPALFEAVIRVRCTSSSGLFGPVPTLHVNAKWTNQVMTGFSATAGAIDVDYCFGIQVDNATASTHSMSTIPLFPGDAIGIMFRSNNGLSGTASNFQYTFKIISK